MDKTHGRILVVDDIEANRDLLKRHLIRRGYEVVLADGGKNALAEVVRGGFDLVLLDIMMPEMNGLETLERMRYFSDRGMLPVIMVSANDQSEDVVQALDMGASDYISKPIDFPVAFARIETHIELKRANDAARNSEARSIFLAKLSHELRTPLNAIIGFSDIMSSDMLGPGQEDQYQEYAGLINESGEHLLVLISDMLDFATIESSGGIQLDEQTFDAAALVRSCIIKVRERSDAANAPIEIDIGDSLPLLRADEARFKQIVLNLLSNAIRFTPSDGSVTVRFWYNEDGGFVLQVTDTGIGIANIPNALASFQQEASSADHTYGGIGIGLSFAKSLIERHGGTLDLQSEVGVGTTATVRLPSNRADEITENSVIEVFAQN